MTLSAPALEHPAPAAPTLSAEVTRIHTRLLKCPLALDACRAYWAHVPADRPASVDEAFRAGWFGVKSEAWVEVLLSNMRARFDAHADALWVLRHWRHMGADTRAVIGHVHLAIVDPLYRRFTGEYLPELRRFGQAVTRHGLLRFVEEHGAEHWTLGTRLQFASRLCASAEEAGLLRGKRDPREVLYPRVPDDALRYVLQLLRGLSFSGTLLDNVYLASLGFTRADVLARAPRLDALTLLVSGPSIVCEWRHPIHACVGHGHRARRSQRVTTPRTPLEGAFDALKRDLIHEDGPQISTMRNYRYAILVYQPEDEFRQRELAQRLVTDLAGGGFVVQTLSLQSLFMQCLEDIGEEALSRVAELERQIAARSPERGLTHLKSKLEVWLNDEETGIAARVSRELDRFAAAHPDKLERSLVLVGRAGALYPFFRVSTLLKRLENNARLPVVLLYPGERRGPTGLSFMGELVPEGDYRPRIYA